jgi:hypothetical protein
VEFADSAEDDREVLRIILPDTQMETGYLKMDDPYDRQWEGIY